MWNLNRFWNGGGPNRERSLVLVLVHDKARGLAMQDDSRVGKPVEPALPQSERNPDVIERIEVGSPQPNKVPNEPPPVPPEPEVPSAFVPPVEIAKPNPKVVVPKTPPPVPPEPGAAQTAQQESPGEDATA